jgi:hypothetical protein
MIILIIFFALLSIASFILSFKLNGDKILWSFGLFYGFCTGFCLGNYFIYS